MSSLILLNKPDYLLPQVVDFLTKGWQGSVLDLSELIIVLPTQEARRRLHEALVKKASSQNAALLPPLWMLPMQLTEVGRTDLTPSTLEQLLWMEVIASMTQEELQRLFPRKRPQFDPTGVIEFANSLTKLRWELSQAGMTLRDVEAKKPADARWQALISLENRYLQRISQSGFRDRIEAQREGVENPGAPEKIKKLVIAGVPDLPKVYETMLPRMESLGVEVSLLVYDPLDCSEIFFDSLGRPNAAWEKKPIPLKKECLHLCLDIPEIAEKTALLAQASGGSGDFCAVGVTTTELASPILDAFQRLGMPAFNPAGHALDKLSLGRLLRLLGNHLRENDFRSALELLRHPDLQAWLGLDPMRDLGDLDALANHLIPSSLEDLLHRWPLQDNQELQALTISPSLQESLRKLHTFLITLHQGEGAAMILHSFRALYESVDLAQIVGGRESAERIMTWINDGAAVIATMHSLDILTLLVSYLQSGIFTGEKADHAIELPGWLELLWEDAPHLIIAGMNDGLVPESRQDDPFLHESLRIECGLASEASRLRRDSYFLCSIMAARAHIQRRVDLLLSRLDGEGNMLKPSRLLLRPTQEKELPALILELFRELPPRPSEKWQSAWALTPKKKSIPLTLSASSIKDYLACPARFYFKHILKLRKESFCIEEADSATFGTLLHEVLRDFGNTPHLRNFRDEHEIEASLISLWKNLFSSRFGSQLSFPLLYQLEAGIRRLRGAAHAQSTLRAEGWEIVACERRFEKFPLHGMKINGQIDRIDRRVIAGKTEWRIIDYKSSEKNKTPAIQHFQALKREESQDHFAAYESFDIGKKTHRWIDLQLPLYQLVLRSEMEAGHSDYLGLEEIICGQIEVGYFTMPKKISETTWILFDQLDNLSTQADACLKGVLQSIQEGVFWPPRQPKYDDYETLFFDHLEATSSSGQQTLDPTNLIPQEVEETL